MTAVLAADRSLREQAAREKLRGQAALLRGEVDASSLADVRRPTTSSASTLAPLPSRVDMLRTLFGWRKNVRARPVKVGARNPETRLPRAFPYHLGGRMLPKLARPVGECWLRLLTSISTNSLEGGRNLGSQGRNLAVIVEKLRSRCYVKVDGAGHILRVRESVILVVESREAGGPSFARDVCGMSPDTFYRALNHPLAHLFVRTQKVQDTRDGQRVNLATRFTVAHLDPPIPADVMEACFTQPVDEGGVFVVQDYVTQVASMNQDGTTRNSKAAVENLNPLNDRPGSRGDSAEKIVLAWEDGAALASPRTRHFEPRDETRETFPVKDRDRWSKATEIALRLGEKKPLSAALGYYRALGYLGEQVVRAAFQYVARRVALEHVRNPGAYLMTLLNKKARAITRFDLRDLPLDPVVISSG